MRRFLIPSLLVVSLFGCAAPAPEPEPAPEPPPVTTPAASAPLPVVEVTASALNVRASASPDADVVVQVKRGARLSVLKSDETWTHVRLESGEEGWVATRFVAAPGARATSRSTTASRSKRKSGGCPPDSDFAFLETPTLAFSDSGAYGLVVIEATISSAGAVQSTKVLSNTTGDESLAFLAVREIRGAKFSPPIRNCVPRSFIYTYRRTY